MDGGGAILLSGQNGIMQEEEGQAGRQAGRQVELTLQGARQS